MGATGTLTTGQSAGLSAAGPGISAISTIGDTFVNAQARKTQAEYQQGIDNVNARFAEVQAEDSIVRGDYLADEVVRRSNKNLSLVRGNVQKVLSGQRTATATQGIDVNSGSAADIQADTKLAGELDQSDIQRNTALDVITIKNNAWRQAWGFKTQAEIYRGQGRMANLAGQTGSRNTLLTGATKSLGYGIDAYARYKNAGGGFKPPANTNDGDYQAGE